jgi:hypothetical protein
MSGSSLSLLPSHRERIASDLARISQAPESCEVLASDLLTMTPILMRIGETELTDTVLSILDRCSDPHVALQTERFRQRRAWESER